MPPDCQSYAFLKQDSPDKKLSKFYALRGISDNYLKLFCFYQFRDSL